MHFQFKGKKTWLIVLAAKLFFVVVLAAGCTERKVADNGNADRKKITDCAGKEVMLPAEVEKVVDLALLDGTRTMVELQVADKLVAVNDVVKDFMYGQEGKRFGCWFAPPKAAPHLEKLLSVGNCLEPNVELIQSLKPDLVLVYASYAELADALEKQTGLPVACIQSSGCLDFKMIETVAEITGKKQRAAEMIAYARQKTELVVQRHSRLSETDRVKVFFWGWPVQNSPKTIAPYDPIDLAGGVNVAMQARIKPYESYDVTKEQLAVWDPDVIVLQWWTPKNIGVRVDTILADPALQTVSAVKKRQVFFSRSFMKGWDPAMGLCEIHYLAKLFYPELYRHLDVERECNEILKKFYGKDGLYTDFVSKSELHRWTGV